MLEARQVAVSTRHWYDAADPAVVEQAVDRAAEFALDHGMDEPRLRDVRLAVREAVTNAARHAYPDGSSGQISIDAATDGRDLTVRVQDRGVGVAGQLPGLGTKLMRSFADRVEMGARLDGRGTVVLMEFSLTPRPFAL